HAGPASDGPERSKVAVVGQAFLWKEGPHPAVGHHLDHQMHAHVVAAIADRMYVARVECPELPRVHLQSLATDDEVDLGIGHDGHMKPKPSEWKVPRHVAMGMNRRSRANSVEHQLLDGTFEEIANPEHLWKFAEMLGLPASQLEEMEGSPSVYEL